MNIKPRKQMLVVELKDGTILYTDSTLDELSSILNREDTNYLCIDGVLFGKFEFKKAYQRDPDDLLLFKRSLPLADQLLLEKREQKMKELGKKRESVKQIQDYLTHKKSNQ